MKKINLILAILTFTAAAQARVDIFCEWTDSNEYTVSYNVTGEPNKVRAFALDIVLADDANIIEVDTSVNSYYTIFPGSIVISGGEITDRGSAVADPCDYPEDTQPGLGSSGVTIEMGALWSPPNDSSPNAPPDSGVLLKYYVDVSQCCDATITINSARGGVVLTDPDEDPEVNAVGCWCWEPPRCLIDEGDQEFDDWETWGRPDCWCYCRQCRGDIDGKKQFGVYWVFTDDLNIFKANFAKNPVTNICSDMDHKVQFGIYRVFTDDLNIFKSYFAKPAALVPPCDQAPIITGPYNFWCDPVNGCPGVCQ